MNMNAYKQRSKRKNQPNKRPLASCVKPEKNLIFLKNGKNSKIVEMVQGSLEKFLDIG